MEVLKVNGDEKEFPQGVPRTLGKLLDELKVESAMVAAEIDGQIIERGRFARTSLHSGQSIELVRFVPGG